MAQKGIRVSPGIYRDPRTGQTYRSTTGALPGSSSGGSKTKQPKGFLSDAPQLNRSLGNLNDARGVITGQLNTNQYIMDKNLGANRVNESTPVGDTQFVRNPDGSFTKRTTLSEGQQGLLNQYERGQGAIGQGAFDAANQARQRMNQGYSYDGLAKIPGQDDLIADRRRQEDMVMGRFDERMNPQFQRETQQAEQQLIDRGVMPGSAQYKQQMDDIYRRQQDSRRDYQVSAMQQGGQEQRSTFGMGLQGRQQGVSEYQDQYFAPQQSMGNFASQFRGPMMPNPEATAAVNFGNVDVGGTQGMFMQNSLARAQLAKQGSGGGGGGASPFNASLLGMLGNSAPQVQPGAQRQNPWAMVGQGFGQGATVGAMRTF